MKYAIITIAFLIILTIVYVVGYNSGGNYVKNQWSLQKLADAKVIQQRQKALEEINFNSDKQYQKGLTDGQEQLQNALDKLAIANKRLRNKYSTNNVSKTTTTASIDNATTSGKFLDASGAAAILRLAAAADNNTKQLTACQNILAEQQRD